MRAGASAGAVVVIAAETKGSDAGELPPAEDFKEMVGFPSSAVVKPSCRAVLLVSQTHTDTNMTLR